jgi:hypothetical protein
MAAFELLKLEKAAAEISRGANTAYYTPPR